jgi:hypothetical protein
MLYVKAETHPLFRWLLLELPHELINVMILYLNCEDMQLTVAFPGQGVKQLMWRYAPLKKI